MRASKRKGYTLIEVVMALAILTAGSVGIMALQQAATRGNMDARQITTATLIAQRWLERIRRDSLNWTSPTNVVDPTRLATTSYLRNVSTPGSTPAWFVPLPAATSGESAAFDYYGNDTTDTGQMQFCTQARLEWLYPGRAMRADVRVWWARRGSGTDRRIGIGNADRYVACAAGTDPNSLTADFNVRMVYATTVIRYTTLPRVR